MSTPRGNKAGIQNIGLAPVLLFHLGMSFFGVLSLLLAISLPLAAKSSTNGHFRLDRQIKANLAKRYHQSSTVLWWNIARAEINTADLIYNLRKLSSNDNAPNLIVLAEFPEKEKDSSWMRVLRNTHPHFHYFEYPLIEGYGLAVISKDPVAIVRQVLPATNPNWSDERKKAFEDFWVEWIPSPVKNLKMNALKISYQQWGRTFHVFASHFVMPWIGLKRWQQNTSTWVPLEIRLAKHFLFERNTPLVYQATAFNSFVFDHLEDMAQGEAVAIVGDFNIPDRVVPENSFTSYSPSPMAYVKLAKGLSAVIKKRHFTYPVLAIQPQLRNKNKPTHQFMIDHAFVDSQSTKGQGNILFWRGSDHYPLHVEFGSR